MHHRFPAGPGHFAESHVTCGRLWLEMVRALQLAVHPHLRQC